MLKMHANFCHLAPQAQLTFVGMSGLLLNLIRSSEKADRATSALPSRIKFEGQSGVLS